MPARKDKMSGQERVKKSHVARGDTDDGKTHVPADEPSVSDHPGGANDAPVLDPRNPASKPHGTTMDQVANMESEGQAQTPGQKPPADIHEKGGKARGKGEGH